MHISGADPPFASTLLATYHASPSGDAFIVMDAAGIVRGWSRACEVLLGWSAEEAAGQSISVIFTPEDRDRKIDLYELEVARTKGHAEDDRWHVRRDDSRVWVTGTMTAVKAEDGSLLGFVKVMRDRTDLRTKIEHLEQERDTLQERLQRAQLFLHTLGHELRNPLAPLSMAVHLMGTRETAPASAQAIQVIQRQIAVLKGLADDLMDLARAHHDGFELALEPVHVQQLLSDALQDLQPNALAKGIEVLAVFQEAPITLQADRRRLTQVVLNLLGNALKYTPSGGTVFLKAGEEVNEVVIRVEDSGIGIGADMLPRIFEFFTQDAGARRMAPGGLGVGLGLVRQIVELHGGTVAARSAGQAKGSEFTVRLPLQRLEPLPPAPV
ncbi:PAS domain-containing sensor histidine kinase [Pseudorhodoferax sp. LjRoot39]|uniref:PAS domain-containing sensor histidine kinase n=1 Tax=Pseudorhodoferax sp. LjRoot39 TaxID=3342328 RepID=UPI003ECF7C0E